MTSPKVRHATLSVVPSLLASHTPRELVSLTCLLVAAKFIETRSPPLEDLCTLSQGRLAKEDEEKRVPVRRQKNE